MPEQKVSTMTEVTSINTGDFMYVVEDDGAGGYDPKKYDLGDLADAVSKKHDQGTDTTLGTMTADIDMNNTYQVIGLAAPAAAGEAIRQTTNITESNLEQLTGGSDTTLHDHDGISENTSARHTQNTDTKLDEGGANEVTAAEIVTLRDTTVPAKADKLILETAEKTTDYTLADGDQDKVVLMNKTGAATLTVPANDTVAFSVGTIVGVYNVSSDTVTIAGDAGVTVRNAGNLAQYGEVSLRKRATDEWVLAGASNAGVLPPTNVTAEVSGSDIIISWTAATFADGYRVYQQIDGGTWTKLNATATTDLTYTMTPTTPGEYNFLVASVRGFAESAPSAETLTSEAMMQTVYSDTITGLRISAVDGTAFVDNVAAVTGYADGNHLIEIEDSAGKVLSGVLKTQGSGETTGSEIATGTLTADILYKITATEADHFGTGLTVDDYFTSAGVETCDASNTVVPVTAPSTNGATLVNEIFGSTQNLVSVDDGLAYNEASYAVRVKRILPVVYGLLDDFSGAAAAYSVRRLDADYTGPVMKVRRASDDEEIDIYFDFDGDLNTAALEAFCSGTDGFVVTWYDQSGNSQDATQATGSEQPQIVNNGNIITNSGKAALDFTGGLRLFTPNATYLNNQKDFFIAAVVKPTASGGQVPTIFGSYTSSGYKAALIYDYSGGQRFEVGGRRTGADSFKSAVSSTDSLNLTKVVIGHLNYRDGVAHLYENGDLTGEDNSFHVGEMDSATSSLIDGIGGQSSMQSFVGKIQEIVVYASDQSANRTGIEQNMQFSFLNPELQIALFTDLHISSQCSTGGVYGKYCLQAESKAAYMSTNFVGVDAIISLGDFLDLGCSGECSETKAQADSTISSVVDSLESAAPFYTVFGNHDPKDLTKNELVSYINTLSGPPYYWYVDINNIRFIGLDAQLDSDGNLSTTDRGHIPTAEKDWLQNTALNTYKKCIVFCHQRLDEDGADWYLVDNASEVRLIFENAGNVIGVFTGHYHSNAYALINDIPYITLIAACKQDLENAAGYAIVSIYENDDITISGFDGQDNY